MNSSFFTSFDEELKYLRAIKNHLQITEEKISQLTQEYFQFSQYRPDVDHTIIGLNYDQNKEALRDIITSN